MFDMVRESTKEKCSAFYFENLVGAKRWFHRGGVEDEEQVAVIRKNARLVVACQQVAKLFECFDHCEGHVHTLTNAPLFRKMFH